MAISSTVIRFIQNELNERGHAAGDVDGRLGADSEGALRRALRPRRAELPDDWEAWPRTKLLTGYVQLRCRD